MYKQSLRTDVLQQASIVRAKLEGNINGNIHLIGGLVATLMTEPDMDQERFAALSSSLLLEKTQIRNIAGARDFIVHLMHPLKGNELAIGLDYRLNDLQRETVIRARDIGELVLAGPVDLVQGGTGFIERVPVFIPKADGSKEFWGIISAVIDTERLYRDSGMLDPQLPIEIALSGIDATGRSGGLFYGSESTVTDDPVIVEVMLPSGSWQLSAAPKGGWPVTPPNVWTIRALMLVAGALVLIPTLLTGRLIEERQRHIRELQDREAELRQLSRRLRLALDTSKVAVWEMSVGEEAEFWDSRMNELYGYPADGAPRSFRHWAKRLHPDDLARATHEFQTLLKTQGSYDSQYRIVLDSGDIRHIHAKGTIYTTAGERPKLVGVNWDVTAETVLRQKLEHANALSEARNAELESTRARIEHNSLHDSLTGLPNRRYLDEYLAEHAEKFSGNTETAALLQIDLDRFKQINDTLGHAAGDAMLIHAAKVLSSTVEEDDFVARIGGDEFVVVRIWKKGDPGASQRSLTCLAQRIVQHMQQPLNYEAHECRVGVSIGIASDMESQDDPNRLLINADIALYRAKDRGRNQYQFFTEALQAEIITTKRVADEILTALDRDQFVAHYQPQFDAKTLDVIGVEALARWNHPTEGLLAPSAFMKIAEELNVVAAIDRLVLEKALLDFRRWEECGLGIPKVSVNVSARRLGDDELITTLRAMDIKPGTIAFELVESIFLDEHDELITWNVDQIKELGIDIEIDDFGTGYASIVSLMKLKPRRLKIDRQLVMPTLHSRGQRQLVGSIIDIGHSLGIEVLAEGVETIGHARALRKLGCDSLQGYAFAKPMSSDDLTDFIRSRRWRDASLVQAAASRAHSSRSVKA